MTFDVLLVALGALVLSNVVLLVAAARSGVLDVGGRSNGLGAEEQPDGVALTDIRLANEKAAAGPPSTRTAGGISSPGLPPAAGPRRAPVAQAPGTAQLNGKDVAALMRAMPRPGSSPSRDTVLPGLRDDLTSATASSEDAAPATPSALDAGVAERFALDGAAVEPSKDDATGAGTASSATGAHGLPAVAAAPSPVATGRAQASQSAVPQAGTRSAGRRTATGGRRGRRFTLPSIEVDHERTERVVLSLLSGDEAPPVGQLVDAWERLIGGEADGPGPRPAVVVALTLDGLDAFAETGGRDAANRLVGDVLDAVRRSARGSDRVASVARGHFRVLLVDADAQVAARFVSRVREQAERRMSLVAAPVSIAAGWAEATSPGGLDSAVRAAEEQRRRSAGTRSGRSRDVSPA